MTPYKGPAFRAVQCPLLCGCQVLPIPIFWLDTQAYTQLL